MSNPLITRLKTPEECEQFAKNVELKDSNDPSLAKLARRRAVELRALNYGATTDAERESLQCIYAFEEARSQETGKRARANRTWQSITKNGILPTVDKVVAKRKATEGYEALVQAGLEDFTFEAVVLKFQDQFSEEAVRQAQTRLNGGVA